MTHIIKPDFSGILFENFLNLGISQFPENFTNSENYHANISRHYLADSINIC